MADKKFELGDYIEVKDRIAIFYELYPNGRLVTLDIRFPKPDDDVPRITVYALAYRTPDDPLPGTGTSWMELPGRTPYTKGSEVENAETSAWGRAIASLGILIDKSIASAQEVQNKQDDGKSRGARQPAGERVDFLGNITKTGQTIKGGPDEYQGKWRQGVDGPTTGFKLKLDGEDRDIPQVLIGGDVGRGLSLLLGEEPVLGLRVTVRGKLMGVRPPKGGTFYRLIVENTDRDFIDGPFGRVPAAAELVATEATSEPLFGEPSDDEKAAIIAAVLEVSS